MPLDLIYLSITVIAAIPVLHRIGRELLEGKRSTDLLAAVSIITGIFLGQYLLAMLIIVIANGVAVLERYAVRRSSPHGSWFFVVAVWIAVFAGWWAYDSQRFFAVIAVATPTPLPRIGLGLSAVGMYLAASGYLPPLYGALLKGAIDVLSVLSAMRATRTTR